MAKKEANFDLYIHQLLCEAGIKADTQGSNNVEIDNALKTASKHQTGKAGYPEYVAVVQDFVIVMEDKADRNNLWLKNDEDKILLSVSATRDYAVNGAVYYAKKILRKQEEGQLFGRNQISNWKHCRMKHWKQGKRWKWIWNKKLF